MGNPLVIRSYWNDRGSVDAITPEFVLSLTEKGVSDLDDRKRLKRIAPGTGAQRRLKVGLRGPQTVAIHDIPFTGRVAAPMRSERNLLSASE